MVPVLEAASRARIGRFGWKNQHASLVSFSADAYLNEMGITSPLFPDENTSNGRFVGSGSGYDPVADPEDDGVDVKAFADFMRATKAPPRGACQPRYWREKPCLTKLAALFATRLRSPRRAPGRKSMAERSLSRPRSATRSSTLTAISCCTTSVRATAYPFYPCPSCDHRQSNPDCPFVGASNSQSADARWLVVDQTGCHPASCRAGSRRDVELQRAVRRREKSIVSVPGFALTCALPVVQNAA